MHQIILVFNTRISKNYLYVYESVRIIEGTGEKTAVAKLYVDTNFYKIRAQSKYLAENLLHFWYQISFIANCTHRFHFFNDPFRMLLFLSALHIQILCVVTILADSFIVCIRLIVSWLEFRRATWTNVKRSLIDFTDIKMLNTYPPRSTHTLLSGIYTCLALKAYQKLKV